ncbi:peroxin [Lithohypha guttulata]|nr:peroxin [Lithohypha guttulata]
MFSATRRWLRRNRTGIAIGAAVVSGTYLVGQYVLGKINDARERAALDKVAKENIRMRFEQNQVDCSITVLALLPTLTENVVDALPAEQLTQELQQKKAERLQRAADGGAPSEVSSMRDGDTASLSSFQTGSFMHTSQLDQSGMPQQRRTKAQLWNELKITSIVRAFTLIYSMSLLILLTRIQLNLLGRLNYLSSVVKLSQPPSPERGNSISLENHEDLGIANFGNDFETNRRFLTFSWYLLHRGFTQIMAKVRTAVEEVFGNISPNEGISQQRLSELVIEVRKKVEGPTEQDRYNTRWLPYVLPPREEEESVLVESGVITPPSTSSAIEGESPPESQRTSYVDTSSGSLRRLLDEAADLVDSPSFSRLHMLILNSMFSRLIDGKVIAQFFPHQSSPPPSDTSSHAPRIQELDSAVTVVPDQPRVKLASILAILTRQAHIIGNGSNPPNEYLAGVDAEVKELDSFAAVIYTSNIEAGIDQQQQSMNEGGKLKTTEGFAVSSVGEAPVEELVSSKLESAWEKVTGSTIGSR